MLLVNTLGKFQITDGKNSLDENKMHSQMLIKLFMYLIMHREKSLSSDDIASAVWVEDEVDNPVGALKNLMYRLRKLLNDSFGQQEYIISSRGTYAWNPEVEVIVDVEQFEKIIGRAKDQTDIGRLREEYEEAISIYEGDFINTITDLHWMQNLNTYYHSMYLSTVKSLVKLYSEQKDYEKIEHVCNKALEIDSVDEQIYADKIRACMHTGKLKQAMEHYEIAKKSIHQTLGVSTFVYLEDVYQEWLSMDNGDKIDNIDEIQSDVVEENPDGVFFCSYPVFREIYQLEARKSLRSGLPNEIVLFTIEATTQETDAVRNYRIKQGMERIEKVMKTALRIGDVAARYSESQYLLMLSNCTKESGFMVANRIVNKITEGNTKYNGIKIRIDIEEVNCEKDI